MIFLALFSKLKGYLIAFVSAVVALAGVYLWGRFKGSEKATDSVEAADAKATEAAVQEQAQARQEVDDHVEKLPTPVAPKAPITITVPPDAQVIGSAQPGTAAGELQKNWTIK